jgi:hypothetical protein
MSHTYSTVASTDHFTRSHACILTGDSRHALTRSGWASVSAAVLAQIIEFDSRLRQGSIFGVANARQCQPRQTVKLPDFTVSPRQISLTRLQQIRRKNGATSSGTGRMYNASE